jgi:hypothetical protein
MGIFMNSLLSYEYSSGFTKIEYLSMGSSTVQSSRGNKWDLMTIRRIRKAKYT